MHNLPGTVGGPPATNPNTADWGLRLQNAQGLLRAANALLERARRDQADALRQLQEAERAVRSESVLTAVSATSTPSTSASPPPC